MLMLRLDLYNVFSCAGAASMLGRRQISFSLLLLNGTGRADLFSFQSHLACSQFPIQGSSRHGESDCTCEKEVPDILGVGTSRSSIT